MEITLDAFSISLWPAAAAVLGLLAAILWRRRRSLSWLLCFAVFSLYLLIVLNIVFFPIRLNSTEMAALRSVRFWSSVNLIPFKFNLSELPHLVILQIFQNILLTVPFGFGLSFVAQVRPKDFRWLIPAVGPGLETTQMIIALILGYPYRIIDINDAILNSVGVLIGYIIFRLFAWLYIWVTTRVGIRYTGLAAYIYEVASRSHQPSAGL